VEKVLEIFNENRRSAISEIAGRLDPSYGTCQRILKDLTMRPTFAKSVPLLLTDEQKQWLVFDEVWNG
jgi:hypothetical protein